MSNNGDFSIHTFTAAVEPAGYCCEGCGSSEPLSLIRARGEDSCCQERVMVSAQTWRARAIAGVEMIVSQLKALTAMQIVKAAHEREISGLKIQIETMAAIAKAREGNLKRACDERDAAEAKLEACVRLIEANQILDSSEGQTLQPRMDGNRAGLAYAVAMRALIAKGDGSNG